MAKYVARTTISKVLRQLEKKHGIVHPHDLVEFARPENSPLHGLFQWDNKKAADAYRLWQARQIIADVYIITDDNKKIPAYQNIIIHTEEGRTQGYYSMEKILSEEDMHQQLLKTVYEELMYLMNKYQLLKEVVSFREVIKGYFSKYMDNDKKSKNKDSFEDPFASL